MTDPQKGAPSLVERLAAKREEPRPALKTALIVLIMGVLPMIMCTLYYLFYT